MHLVPCVENYTSLRKDTGTLKNVSLNSQLVKNENMFNTLLYLFCYINDWEPPLTSDPCKSSHLLKRLGNITNNYIQAKLNVICR